METFRSTALDLAPVAGVLAALLVLWLTHAALTGRRARARVAPAAPAGPVETVAMFEGAPPSGSAALLDLAPRLVLAGAEGDAVEAVAGAETQADPEPVRDEDLVEAPGFIEAVLAQSVAEPPPAEASVPRQRGRHRAPSGRR